VVGFVLDEVDKCPQPVTRAPLSQELLSICDESVEDVSDNYLGFRLEGLKHCPLIMTANAEKKIDPILRDRCILIHFPKADKLRIRRILEHYARKKLRDEIYDMIDLDLSLLEKNVELLLQNGVHSIRQHQQCLERVLGLALREAAHRELKQITVSELHFAEARKEILRHKDK